MQVPQRRRRRLTGTSTNANLTCELDRVAEARGYLALLRCDNGHELACAAMVVWADDRLDLHCTPPGEPWRNGYYESFNSRIREECLSINILWSMAQARVVIADWKEVYTHATAQLPLLPPPSGLRCSLHPSMNTNSHKVRTSHEVIPNPQSQARRWPR